MAALLLGELVAWVRMVFYLRDKFFPSRECEVVVEVAIALDVDLSGQQAEARGRNHKVDVGRTLSHDGPGDPKRVPWDFRAALRSRQEQCSETGNVLRRR